MKKQHYKTVFISDIHLGNPKNQSDKLVIFLEKTHTDHLIIIWDFIDYRQLNRFWKWTTKESNTINFINKLSSNWTKITYIKWNHDENISPSYNIHLEKITTTNDLIYKTWNWKSYYVTHGHNLDKINSSKQLIWKFWSFTYWLLLKVESTWNKKCILPWEKSIAETIEQRIKTYRFSNDKLFKKIEQFMKGKTYDWIILWHFHQPMHCYINNLEYLNTWDWLKSCSAIVENDNWNLELIYTK